ncbi:MAG TPA: hypothetical protein VHQ90_13705 [Thermoanaerobaculia bacterium]|nr:hypothetical protein [Thermoanaerobaculia bacterium]
MSLERAPGELGKVESTGTLFLVTAAKGKEVLLFDSGSGQLTTYLEATGATWGKPVHLRGSGGDTFSPQAFRVAVNGELIAFSNPLGVYLFNRNTGEFLAEAPYLNHAAAIAATPDGWAVSLTRLPFPAFAHADKEKFGGPAPRFVVVNDKLEIWRQGLPAQSDRTPNQAAARALRLAGSPDRLFAAEIANYKVYEFDRKLKLQATYVDPRLKLEAGLGLGLDKRDQERFLSEAHQKMASAGTDASKPVSDPRSPAARGQSEFFTYQTVISDMAWDPFSHQLVLLLADGIAADQGALDLLDPTTGQVQRLLLRFPEGAGRRQLTQLAVGHHYLWLRSHAGASPTFRLDRSALELARTITGLTLERSAMAGKQ